MSDLVPVTSATTFSLAPRNLEEAMSFAKLIADSDLAPKDFRGKPGNVLIAVQMGAEVGLSPMQAIQNVAVVNGRPSLWGDAMLAIVCASAVYEGHREQITGEAKTLVATCTVKRRGQEWQARSFSVLDAERAGLWGKQGPWQQYPKRMLQLRARAFALRDVFPDVLRGLQMVEETQDAPDMTVEAVAPERPALRAPQRKSALPPAPPVVVEAAPPSEPESAPAEPTVETVATISPAQWEAMRTKAKACKFTDAQFKAWLENMNIRHGSDIRADEYDDLLAALDAGPRS